MADSEDGHTTATCRGRAERLYDAMNGGRAESAVFREVEGIATQREWDEVATQFAQRHPEYYDGNLPRALTGTLQPHDLHVVHSTLSAKKISLEGHNDLKSLTTRLYTAMKGVGTDEDAIYSVITDIRRQSEWDWVKAHFRQEHADFCGGDLVAALRGDLSRRELKKVTGMLAQRGIYLDSTVTSQASSVDTISQKGAEMDTAARADLLYSAMNGFNATEANVHTALSGVADQEQWDATQRHFQQRHAAFHHGNLVRALSDELTATAMQRAEEILATKGITLLTAQSTLSEGSGSVPFHQVTKTKRRTSIVGRLMKKLSLTSLRSSRTDTTVGGVVTPASATPMLAAGSGWGGDSCRSLLEQALPASHHTLDSRTQTESNPELYEASVSDAVPEVPPPVTPPGSPMEVRRRPLGRLVRVIHTRDGDAIVEKQKAVSSSGHHRRLSPARSAVPPPALEGVLRPFEEREERGSCPRCGSPSPSPSPSRGEAASLTPYVEVRQSVSVVEKPKRGFSPPPVRLAGGHLFSTACTCRLCLRAHCERLTRRALDSTA